MQSSQKKASNGVIVLLAICVLAFSASYFASDYIAHAQEERSEEITSEDNPYQDLTQEEASQLAARLIANPSLADRLPEEKKGQLSQSKAFQDVLFSKEKEFVSDRRINEALTLKKVVTSLYPPLHPFISKAERLFTFGERLERFIAVGDVAALKRLSSDDHLSPEEREVLQIQLSEFLKTTVNESLQEKNPTAALISLSQIPKEQTGALSRTLASQTISLLINNPVELHSEPFIKAIELIVDLANNDPGSRQAILDIFGRGAVEAAEKGNVDELKAFLNLIKTVSPAHTSSELLLKVLTQGTRGLKDNMGMDILAELERRDAIPASSKVKLLLKGYYGKFIPLLIIMGSLCLTIVSSILLLKHTPVKSMFTGVTMPQGWKKKTVPGYMRPLPAGEENNIEDEYTRLLRIFGLNDTATENEIKSAFRTKMKVLHPDGEKASATENFSQNSGQFRELKHAHDRIIEIRKSWFRGRGGFSGKS